MSAPAESAFWDPRAERMPRSEIEALQTERLRHQVRYVYENAPLVRELYDAAGVRPADVRSLADLAKLPVREKRHIRACRERHHHPFGGTPCEPAVPLCTIN